MLANAGAAKPTVPERTNWFNMEDANRFTAQQQQKAKKSEFDTFSNPENKKLAPADDVQVSESTLVILDTLPVEIEVRCEVHSTPALLTA